MNRRPVAKKAAAKKTAAKPEAKKAVAKSAAKKPAKGKMPMGEDGRPAFLKSKADTSARKRKVKPEKPSKPSVDKPARSRSAKLQAAIDKTKAKKKTK